MPNSDQLTGKPLRLRPGVQLQVCHEPGTQPAIAFLHGGLGNRFNLRSQYEFAVAQGWEAVAYDLAGHGQSSPYPCYSIGRHCRDLTRLLRHFRIQRPILFAHSYGVPIALEWCQRHPVAGLVLVAGGTHDLDPWWEVPLMQSLAWGGRHLFRLHWVQRLAARFSSDRTHATLQQFLAESPVPAHFAPYQALQIFWGYNFFTRRSGTWQLNYPTLIISGGQDPMFTHDMGAALVQHFPQGHHLHLENAGHLVMAEYPDTINQALLDFWNQANRALRR
ncbi:alpha/beta fold hydrolase [Leptolyngbya iicbica]|uniref:Alpha/beta hydrolase n=2 Tax=Cyanophyceae TaxID=3028117 RepID=A0A4Q7E6D5_9CYAN|nr:alpha/beta hydrolase [Leptolyngbya sp. LK]RZM77763.1 alpha/beta hydrolase [Leptolyngbya sp. LK]